MEDGGKNNGLFVQPLTDISTQFTHFFPLSVKISTKLSLK